MKSPAVQSSPALKPADQKLLRDLEAQVEKSAMDFCVALAEIHSHKDGIFWKSEYSTFQEYVRVRFGYGEQHAGRLVAAGGFVLQLEDSKSTAPRPVRENQVRPLLNKLPTKHLVPCWEQITEKTAPAKLTGDIIEAEVITYRKTIPKQELEANKRPRKAKKDRIPPEEKAREKSHALVDRLKAFAGQLPQSDSILKVLKELKSLIDRKK